jgi:hypothetical protein
MPSSPPAIKWIPSDEQATDRQVSLGALDCTQVCASPDDSEKIKAATPMNHHLRILLFTVSDASTRREERQGHSLCHEGGFRCNDDQRLRELSAR